YIVRAVPSRTFPCRREDPATKHSASTSVVFPEPPWPRTATFLICSVRYSLAAVMRTSRGADFAFSWGTRNVGRGPGGVKRGGRSSAPSAPSAAPAPLFGHAERAGLTQSRGVSSHAEPRRARRSAFRAGLRSSWSRAFLARIHV